VIEVSAGHKAHRGHRVVKAHPVILGHQGILGLLARREIPALLGQFVQNVTLTVVLLLT
jgi:hypothetical protein